MKKCAFFLVLLVFSSVFIGQVRQWSDGKDMLYHVNVVNSGKKDAGELRVAVYIPDLAFFKRTNRFDLDDRDATAKTIFEQVPNALSGAYLTKITLSDSEKGTLDTKYIYTII